MTPFLQRLNCKEKRKRLKEGEEAKKKETFLKIKTVKQHTSLYKLLSLFEIGFQKINYKKPLGRVRWLIPVIPILWAAKVKGSLER